jgi:hypothetical protein
MNDNEKTLLIVKSMIEIHEAIMLKKIELAQSTMDLPKIMKENKKFFAELNKELFAGKSR